MKLFMRASVMILFLASMLFASSAAPVRALSAGPDGFDYYYVDSVDPGSNPEEPVYNLEDISASGTPITGLGDAGLSVPLNLGFSFRYYGVSYNQVYVCANGLIIFVSPGSSCPYPDAEAIPNNITPDPEPEPTGLVAGWWGDLDLTHSGAIYYATLGNEANRYFVVEFLAVPHFDYTWTLASPPLDPVTLEFKLFEGTNNIEVHYSAAPASTLNHGAGQVNHSAGIENAAGTIGLQYYFDDDSLATPVAVRYYYNDATPPQINITSQPTNPTSNPVGAFTFTVSDTGGSGLATVTCRLDGGSFADCIAGSASYPGLSDGSHTFEINALDGSANPASASYTWLVDTTPPDTTILTNPPDPSNSASPSFTFSGSDTGGSGILRLECQLDGGGFATCTSPRNLSGLADGSHTFQVQAVDHVGYTDPTPASYTWVVDATPPDTSILTNPPDPSGSTSAAFTFSGSDTGTGLARLECRLDGAVFATCTSPHTLNSLPDGSRTFQVRAVDNAGNPDPTPASYTWLVDTTPPDTNITANPPNPSASTAADFSFTGSDAGSGVDGFECRLDGAVFSACSTPQHLTGLSNATHTFQVRAIDNIGLTDPTPASYTWMVDTVAPDTTILTNPPDPSNSASPSFTFSGSDTGGSGILRLECRLDGGGFTTCTSPRNLSGLADGPHTFQVRAVDNAGNTDSTPDSYTWVIDTVAPDTSILTNPPNPSGSVLAGFTFSGSDTGGSGVAGFECRLDGAGFTTCTSPQTLVSLTDGSHTFYVRAVDNAGNPDPTPASYTWLVDTTPPDTSITANPPNPSNSATANFTFSGSDTGGSGVLRLECQLDVSGFATCTSPRNLVGLLDGSHTFQVRAVDNLGYVDPTPASYTWVVDTVAPDTTILTNPPDPSNSASPSFTFSGSDTGGSGVLRLECRLDSGGFATCTSPRNLTGLLDGPHTFQVRAVDNAGNTDPTPASYTWVVDATPPDTSILTNPPDPSGSVLAGFTFSGSDDGGSGVGGFECRLDGAGFATCTSPHTLNSLADGSHTFYVRAVDNAGNPDPTPAGYTWVVDTAAPTVTLLTQPANPTNSTTGSFTFSGNGTGSALAAMSCKLDAEFYTDCSGGSASYPGLSDGPHTFSVYAVDAVGNNSMASPTTYTWTVDTAAPAVPLLLSPADNALTIQTSLTLTWQASTGAAGYLLILDGGAPQDLGNVTSFVPPVLSAGEHTWSVAAYDAAGNTSAYATSFKFIVGIPMFLPFIQR